MLQNELPDYFTLFNLPKSYALASESLKAKYIALIKLYHPDHFGLKMEVEKNWAQNMSAYVNDAFKVLNCPIERACYLLKLNGIDLTDETDTITDSHFIMRQMELREEWEELSNKVDNRHQSIKAFKTKVHKEFMNRQEALTGLFEGSQWIEARKMLREMQYFNKLLSQVVE